jgi:CO/xanthine dehydrogenase FAD-binding subunit
MSRFQYVKVSSVDEGLDRYLKADGKAIYLAGGTDVLLKTKKKQIEPEMIISLNGIKELAHIEDIGDSIKIGSLVTLTEIARSELIRKHFPILVDAVTNMASRQIRNAATMAGNIANAAPSADTAPPALALGAKVDLHGQNGDRTVDLDKFYKGPYKTVMEKGDILTSFTLPKPSNPAGGGYAKLTRRAAMDLALLGVAVQLGFEDDGQTCKSVCIGLGVAAPTPIRAYEAEKFLQGKKIDQKLLDEAGNIAANEASPRDSIRCEAWYRVEMIKVFVRRMGLLSLERAKG